MASRKFNKRGQVDHAQLDAEAVRENDFHNRAALNKTLGMSARHPFAFGLSAEGLDKAWEDVKAGNPPVPIVTATNGLRVLSDPWREQMRRQRRDALPGLSLAERKARYLKEG